VLNLADFGSYADAEGSAISAVKIETLPSGNAGVLKLNNVAVTAGAEITVADIVAGKLSFVAVHNASGSDHFDFRVSDGTGFSASSYILTVNVTEVNDAPTVSSGNLSQLIPYTEGATSVTLGDIVVADVDAGDAITAVLTLSAPAAGTLSHTGVGETYDHITGLWIKSGTVAEVNAALAAVTFNPATGNAASVTITTQIHDAAGTGPATGLVTLNMTAVNDVPALTGTPATLAAGTEDHTYLVSTADLLQGYTDADGDTLSISSLSVDHGTLSAVDASGVYTFTPDANSNGTVTLTSTVSDGHTGLLANQTHSFLLTPVNDAPTGTVSVSTSLPSGAQVAAAVVAAGATTGYNVTLASAETVRFTAMSDGNRTDVTNVKGAGSYSGTTIISKIQDGTSSINGNSETFVLNLVNNDSQARTLIFQGVSHAIAANATADSIATALNGDVFGSWTATHTASGQVTFTHSAHADQTNITIADFTGTYKPLTALPSIVESSVSNFLLQAVATDSVARTFTLDSATMTIDANQTAAQVASQIAAHGTFGKWNTAVVENSTEVRFTDTDVAVVAPSSNTLISQHFDTAAAFTDNFTQSNPATKTFAWANNVGLS